VNIKEMSIAQLQDLRVSVEAELVDRNTSSKSIQQVAESLLLRMSQPQPEPQTQQSIAAKTEAEITARAEALLQSASRQRVVI
jgi:organic radical activating enzyme